MPLGDSVRDDLGRGRGHLRKGRITHCLSLYPLPFRLQMTFSFLQVSYQSIDLCNRGGSELLNERRHLCVSFCLHPKLRVGKIANFPFDSQTCGNSLEVRHLKLHGTAHDVRPW